MNDNNYKIQVLIATNKTVHFLQNNFSRILSRDKKGLAKSHYLQQSSLMYLNVMQHFLGD